MKRDIEWLVAQLRQLDQESPGIEVTEIKVTPMEACDWMGISESSWVKWEDLVITMTSTKRREVVSNTVSSIATKY